MRIAKLLGILAGTIILYLILLRLHIPFGIALIAALGAMAVCVRRMRKNDAYFFGDDEDEEDPDAEDPEEKETEATENQPESDNE